MAFKPAGKIPDFAALKATYVGARDQVKDYLLFQTITQFLDLTSRFQSNTRAELDDLSDGSSDISDANYATVADDSILLPNSRQLLAGVGVAFDDTVANERTIDVSGSLIGYYEPLTDGDLVAPELIFALGDVISVFIPT
jgi:hypothetical protein